MAAGAIIAAVAFQAAGVDLIVQWDGRQNGGNEELAYDIRRQSYPLPAPAQPDWRFWLADTEVQPIAGDAVCDDQLLTFIAQVDASDAMGSFSLSVKYSHDGSFQVSWHGGRLEAAADLAANDWIEIPQLRSPALLKAGAKARFFRVVE